MEEEAKVKSKRGRSAVNKGRQGEREAGKQLDRLIGGGWHRSLVQSRSGTEDADIVSDDFPELFVEVKRQRRASPSSALQQACEASSGTSTTSPDAQRRLTMAPNAQGGRPSRVGSSDRGVRLILIKGLPVA